MNVSSPRSPSKRLWLLKHPFFRAPDLPPSRGQRERVVRQAQREGEFHRKHSWWPKLHAYERELIRKIRFSLQKAGDHLASEDLWRALDLVDEIAGLPGVVAVVEELLGGREFEVEGYWVRGNLAPLAGGSAYEETTPAEMGQWLQQATFEGVGNRRQ